MSRAVSAFTPLQRVLHWVMAVCVIAMLFIGVGMVSTIAPSYVGLLTTHKTLGIAILVLVLVRLVVRIRSGAPELPRDLPAPLALAARVSHWLLYGLMIAMPLIGWAMVSAAGYPVTLAGGIRLPALLPASRETHALLWSLHQTLGLAFFALILLHLAAALFHGLVRRDGVMEQMTTGR